MGRRYHYTRWKPSVSQKPSSPQENPSWFQRKFRTWLDRLPRIRKFISEILLICLILSIFALLISVLTKSEIILDPIKVPEDIRASGYTGTIVADRILDAARDIGIETQTLSKDFAWREEVIDLGYINSELSIPNISVPVAGISLKPLIRYLRKAVGSPATYLSGEIVRREHELTLTLRNLSDQNILAVQVTNESSLDELLKQQAGEALLKIAKPSILAIRAYHQYTEATITRKQSKEVYPEMQNRMQYCLDHSPSSDDRLVLMLWGIAHIQLGQYEQAITKFHQVIRLSHNNSSDNHIFYNRNYREWAYRNWGGALRLQKKYDESIEKLEQAINIDRNVYAYFSWGLSLKGLGYYSAAIKLFKKAINADEGHVESYLELGFSLAALEDYKAAVEKFNQAIKIDPSNAYNYLYFGFINYKKKHYKMAISKYRHAIRFDLGRSSVGSYSYSGLSCALSANENYSEAIKQSKKSIELNPKYSIAYINLGWALTGLKRYPEALVQYAQANEITPKDPDYYFARGAALAGLKRYDEAIDMYRQALEQNISVNNVFSPSDAYYHWGLALERLGRQEDASVKFHLAQESKQYHFHDKPTRYYQDNAQANTLTINQQVTLHYDIFKPNKCEDALLILPNWSEPKEKYAELIQDLREQNLCIYIYDHRSQGSSSRLLDNHQIAHVDSFQDYIHDLQKFDEQVIRPHKHRSVFVLAHSMGGLIATEYLAKTQNTFSGLLLSAPMFSIDAGIFPEWAAYGITRVLDTIGLGTLFAPSHGEWEEKEFEDNLYTHSITRFLRAQKLYQDHPNLIVSGVSNRWLHSAITSGRKITHFAERIEIPVLLFQADEDKVVQSERQNIFCSQAPNCEKVWLPKARHEVLMEIDSVRSTVLESIIRFIQIYRESN